MGCCGQTTSTASAGSGPTTLDTGKRVNYTQGMLLGVDDFVQEQAWGIARRHELARELLGYGTVRGLQVTLDAGAPRVRVSPGMAWTPSGTPVCVNTEQCCNVNDWLAAHQAEFKSSLVGNPAPLSLYVVLAYNACLTDPVPVPGEPCRSESELLANSRIADCFSLTLRLDPPPQIEEDAIRDFADWLAKVPVDAASPPLSEADFLDQLRDAAQAWLAPVSPSPADYMFGSPPLGLDSTDGLLRAALRLWVTELRPLWRARYGCGPNPIPPGTQDDAVLLARIDLKVFTHTLEADTGIALSQDARPVLLSLRMLQELITQNPAPEPGNAIVEERSFGQASTPGSSTAYARADHSHGTPVLPDLAGDVTGPITANEVVALRGRAIDATAPTERDVLALTAAGHWAPAPLPQAANTLPAAETFGATGSAGTQASFARADHVHPMPVLPPLPALAGDVTGAIGDNTVTALQSVAVADTAPTAGQVLMCQSTLPSAGPGRPRPPNLVWTPVTLPRLGDIPTAATTAPSGLVFGSASQVGTASDYARADHQHGLPLLGGDVQTDSASELTIVALQRQPLKAESPAKGDVLTFNGEAWVPSAGGSGDAGPVQVIAAGVLEMTIANGKPSVTATFISHAFKVRVRSVKENTAVLGLQLNDLPKVKDGAVRLDHIVLLTPLFDPKQPPVLAYLQTLESASDGNNLAADIVLLLNQAFVDGTYAVQFQITRIQTPVLT
ncbi:MAG: hypothetical protein IV110_06475 [Aquabacterium sp.]|uniref:hypothetical protein n=1 Tax=Aquabacterium sp. TaxID=1872578 RepID=UPI001D4134BD|nr:hypothetical protein [Aquabacterium sp.]MBT9609671.1 hypothetical protein [Aquabacterium sp.]